MERLASIIDQKKQDVERLKAEIVRIEAAHQAPIFENYRERLVAPLYEQARQLQSEIHEIENSWQYANEKQWDGMFAQRREERALQARRQARADAIAAEEAKYDGDLAAFNWSLTPELRSAEDRRAIARAHAEKLAARAAISRRAQQEKGTIETRARDPRTGKNYLIVTDSEGTWAESDTAANLSGDATAANRAG